MSKGSSKTVVRAWARLAAAQRYALATIERRLKAAGLPSLVWYDVLLEVERAGDEGIRPVKLERAMLLAQYNLSRLLDRIERAGYVERRACDADGRGQMIVITDEGRAMRRKMWPVYAAAIEAAVGRRLSEAQAEALDELLGLLVNRRGPQ
jgi:DNA-binding MarR family transcriptional regulator